MKRITALLITLAMLLASLGVMAIDSAPARTEPEALEAEPSISVTTDQDLVQTAESTEAGAGQFTADDGSKQVKIAENETGGGELTKVNPSGPNSTNKKVSFDLDAYNFSDPSQLDEPIPHFLTDEQFFGVWDQTMNGGAGGFSVPSKLDYTYISPYRCDLSKVLAAVKEANGDYSKAKEALLEYYRTVTNNRGLSAPTTNRQYQLTADLLLQCFHYNGNTKQSVADIFEVPSGNFTQIEAEMLGEVENYRNTDTRQMSVYIYAVNKDDYEAEFYSKEGNPEYAPYLEVIAGGSTIKIPAKFDTYVSAGANAGNNYGSEGLLRARETVGGWATPVTDDTKQIYLMFDLSRIPEGTPITSAKLKLYGRWVDVAETPRNNPGYRKTMTALTNAEISWDENTVNFVTVLHPALSYDGQYGFDWRRPIRARVDGKVYPTWINRIDQEMLRFSSWWNCLCEVYRTTGDEDYARTAMMYLDNFIKDTFAVYLGMPPKYDIDGLSGKADLKNNWLTKEQGGNEIYGGYAETLDAHSRASCLARNLPLIYDSEYMTPEILTTFVKYMWSMGDWEFKYWGSSEAGGNWGTAACNGFYWIMATFPEFIDIYQPQTIKVSSAYKQNWVRTGTWMDILWENLEQVSLTNVVHSDGSSGELSLSYTNYALSTMMGPYNSAEAMGIDVEYSPELKKGISQLTRYMMDMALPGGKDNQMGDGGTYDADYTSGRFKPVGEWLNDPVLLWAADRKKGEAPDYTSRYYDVGKMLAMRSDWSDDARYLHINADGGKGTHAHWDDLGVIVSAYGEYLLADPLYYTYTQNDLTHRWLASSRAHNTVEINGYCQTGVNPSGMDSVLPKGGGQGEFKRVEFNDSYDFTKVSAGPNYKNLQYRKHDTMGDLPTEMEPGMDCERNVLFVRPNFWIVSDYFDPVDKEKENTYTQMWHMKPGSNMQIDGQYQLRPGEQIGVDADGKEVPWVLDTQIENTQFVPGTGTGAFYSRAKGKANIMVVPADIETVEPKLMRGIYSPAGDSKTNNPYGMFEKKAVGRTKMDTILFPTKQGEQYDIQPKAISLDLPEGAGSAFSAELRNLSGSSNEEYRFHYYILHDEKEKNTREFGEYRTDGSLAYIETKMSGYPRRMIVEDASQVSHQYRNIELFKANTAVPELSVEWVGEELRLYSSQAVDLTQLTVYAGKKISKVTLNDKDVSYKQKDNFVYFGSTPILDGSDYIPYEADASQEPEGGHPTKDPHSTGGSAGGTTGGSTGGGTGGAGFPVNPAETVKPADPKEALKAELNGHWGQQEIADLIDRGIVNGSDGTLALTSNVTRAEFTVMLLRAFGIEPAAYAGAFADVTAGQWYAGFIQSAFDHGIMEGSDGNAMPDEPITREQAVKIMLKALETRRTVHYLTDAPDFVDTDEISDWAVSYVTTGVSMGLIKGMEDGTFRPQDQTLREQAMVMTYRLLKAAEQN